jgi:hypothetical protein
VSTSSCSVPGQSTAKWNGHPDWQAVPITG